MTLLIDRLETLFEAFRREGKLDKLSEIIKTMQLFASQTAMSHQECLNISYYLAKILTKKCRYDEALEIFYNIESKRSKLYGHDNPKLLATQNMIAHCLKRKEIDAQELI